MQQILPNTIPQKYWSIQKGIISIRKAFAEVFQNREAHLNASRCKFFHIFLLCDKFWKKNSIDDSGTLEPCPSCPAFQLSKMTTACTMVSLNFPRGKGFDGMSEQTHYRRDSQRKRPQSLVKMQMSESNGTHRLLTNCIPLKILQVLCGSFTCWEHIIRGAAHYIFAFIAICRVQNS